MSVHPPRPQLRRDVHGVVRVEELCLRDEHACFSLPPRGASLSDGTRMRALGENPRLRRRSRLGRLVDVSSDRQRCPPLDVGKHRQPLSKPRPWKESIDVRFALSNDALNTTSTPGRRLWRSVKTSATVTHTSSDSTTQSPEISRRAVSGH